MNERVAALMARHLPSYTIRSVTTLGHGLENQAYLVNDEVVVRLRAPGYDGLGLDVQSEAEVLTRVAEVSTLPVPAVLFVDAEAGALAYRKLVGTSLLGNPTGYRPEVASALGEFLGSIHASEEMRTLVPHDAQPLGGWLDDARRDLVVFGPLLTPTERGTVEAFLETDPPADPTRLAFCHNDLGAEHILVDERSGVVSGILDWTDAAMTDPAYDWGLIRRDGRAHAFEIALSHYGLPFDDADWDRAVFYSRCALLEDLAFGVRSGDAPYAQAAAMLLPTVFSD